MVVKQDKKMNLDYGSLLFNGAGFGLIAILIGYTAMTLVVREELAACTARYPAAQVMSLRSSSGDLFSPMELQSFIGSAQRGVTQNARTIEAGGGDYTAAGLRVRMDKGTTTGYKRGDVSGGVGFVWAPEEVSSAKSGCLRYRIKLPEDFDFGHGGMLPGIYGGKPLRADQLAQGDKGFASRPLWGKNGHSAAYAQHHGNERVGRIVRSRKNEWPRGRWIDVQQEVVVNTVGVADGKMRIWADGDLVIEQKAIAWRTSPEIGVEGVISEITYGYADKNVKSPANTAIEISEFELSWKSSKPVQTAKKP